MTGRCPADAAKHGDGGTDAQGTCTDSAANSPVGDQGCPGGWIQTALSPVRDLGTHSLDLALALDSSLQSH